MSYKLTDFSEQLQKLMVGELKKLKLTQSMIDSGDMSWDLLSKALQREAAKEILEWKRELDPKIEKALGISKPDWNQITTSWHYGLEEEDKKKKPSKATKSDEKKISRALGI